MSRNINSTKAEAGKLGAFARMSKYGNPGTAEGRRRGGLRSQQIHTMRNTGFVIRKIVRTPRPSKKFAEFLGIMFGDGSNGAYQATMTTSAVTDLVHANHAAQLAEELFHVKVYQRYRPKHNVIVTTISSATVCDILERNGLPKGSKVRSIIQIPVWISNSKTFSTACARGLFDTDGCTYIDTHHIKGVAYKNICLSFRNHNAQLLEFFRKILFDIGLHPTMSAPHSVFLRKAREIDIFFDIVGTSNPKHLEKYLEFKRSKSGSVA